MLTNYPKIKHLGDAEISEILAGEIVVQEKIDGSQISFGVDFNGNLHIKSKNRLLKLDGTEPPPFSIAIASISAVKDKLEKGYTYRGEFLAKPKHNCLAYDRIPLNHIALYAVETHAGWASPQMLVREAVALGFSWAPVLYQGFLGSPAKLIGMLEWMSCLGGQRIEGVVVKAYGRLDRFGNPMMAKLVRPEFREMNSGKAGKKYGDFVADLGGKFCVEPRWRKAIQHLGDAGMLTKSTKDIGKLISEIQRDIEEECLEEIMIALYGHFKRKLMGAAIDGFPDWYKAELAHAEEMEKIVEDVKHLFNIEDDTGEPKDWMEQPVSVSEEEIQCVV